MKKLENILAENMRRFNTKNLTEQQLDMFDMQDGEYLHNRPEYSNEISYEDFIKFVKHKYKNIPSYLQIEHI